MAFTRSLLIKALGGVAGVSGTTVGVLAGTGVFDRKETNTPPKVPTTPVNPGVHNGADGNDATNLQGAVTGRETEPSNSRVDDQKNTPQGQENNKGNTQQDSQPGRDNAGSTTTDSHDTPGTGGTPKPASPNELGNVDNGEVGGGEHSPGSTSEISEPVSSGSPVQGEGAGGVDTNPQPSEEVQKASEVNTGVTESQQSTPTLQEAPPGAPAGQPGGNNGGSNLPNAGATPRTEDTQNLGTGDNGATGGSSRSPDSPATDSPTQSKEEKINAQLKTLGVPESCNFEKSDTSKTCPISKEELKKMKFEESGDDGVDSEEKSIQLKIEILSENKKTAYGLNDEDGEENNLLFTLSGFKNSIEITHGGSNVYPNTNPEFKVKGSELEKVWDQAVNLAEKVGIKNNEGTYSFKENTTTLKYSLDGTEASIKTLSSPTTSGTIYVEPDKENYNQGVKVTFGGKVTGTGSDSLEKGDYEIKYKDGDNEGWYLSKKNEGTEGKAKGSQGTSGEGVNNPNQPPQPDGSHSSSGLSSEQQLNNNQQEQVPVVDTNSISKTDVSESTQTITENQNSRVNDASYTVDNEGDTATDPQVKETNIKLKELKIPDKCRFTDSNKDKPLECSLSKDEFKEISFEGEEVDESLLEENGESFVMKLIIERLSESKKKDYENEGKQVDLLFTFKEFKGKTEKGCKRGFKVNKDLTFYENTNPEFEGNNENFKSLWGQPLDLAKKVGLNVDGSSCFKFKKTHDNPVQSTKFSVDKGKTIKEVSIPEDSQQKAKAFAEARGYSQGFRFLFKEAVTFENNNTLPAGGYEIVYKNGNGWYLSQVSTDTAENWNEKDSDGKLCVSEEE